MNIQNVQPVGRRMLIEIIKSGEKTSSGLLVAESQTNMAPVMGVVLRSGDECKFKEGDTVMFRRFAVDELKMTAEDTSQMSVHMIEEDEVLAIIK